MRAELWRTRHVSHHLCRFVPARCLDLHAELTRERPHAWFMSKGEHGKTLLHVERHERPPLLILVEGCLCDAKTQRPYGVLDTGTQSEET